MTTKKPSSIYDICLDWRTFSRIAKKRLDLCFVKHKEVFETANQLMWMFVSVGDGHRGTGTPGSSLSQEQCAKLYPDAESTDVLWTKVKKDLEICRLMNIIIGYVYGPERTGYCELWDEDYDESIEEHNKRVYECDNCDNYELCFKPTLSVEFNRDFTAWGHGTCASIDADILGAESLERVAQMLGYNKKEIKERIRSDETRTIGNTVFITTDEVDRLVISRLNEIKKETATK